VLVQLYGAHGWPALQQHRKQLFSTAVATPETTEAPDAATEPVTDTKSASETDTKAASETDESSPCLRPRPLQLWLDNLFHILLDDIVMFSKLPRALEEPSVRSCLHACMEQQRDPPVKARTKMDWYRFGRLATRLHHQDDTHRHAMLATVADGS
jgi:hypothetical protein